MKVCHLYPFPLIFSVEQASLLAPLIAYFGEDTLREVLDAALHALANDVPLV